VCQIASGVVEIPKACRSKITKKKNNNNDIHIRTPAREQLNKHMLVGRGYVVLGRKENIGNHLDLGSVGGAHILCWESRGEVLTRRRSSVAFRGKGELPANSNSEKN